MPRPIQPTTATTREQVKRHAAQRRKAGVPASLLSPEPFRGTTPLRYAYLGALDLAAHLGQALKQQDHWKRRALRAEALLRRAPKALEGHVDMTAEEVVDLLTGGTAGKEAEEDAAAREKVAAEVLTAWQLYPHYRLDYRSNVGMLLTVLGYVCPEAAARLRAGDEPRQIRRDMFPDPEDEE